MKYLGLVFILFMLLTSCKDRKVQSATKSYDDVVTQDQVLSYWIKLLQDPSSYFPDIIHINDDIKIPKSAITDYTIEYKSDSYKYSRIVGWHSFLMLDNGEAFSMYVDGQNTMVEPLLGGGWDGELIHRMKSFMAPRLFAVRRFGPDDSERDRFDRIKSDWKSVTSQGKEFVYRVFADNAQEHFVIQAIGRLEAKFEMSPDLFVSVSDPNVYDLLEQSIAEKLQVEIDDVTKMFEARSLSKVSADKKTYALGRHNKSKTIQWKPPML